ncbi:MAG: NADH-quinone oxidoreductase subunit L [Gammaproteobacteria bacterium]|nr:NADH-quinone oxidoreductase subunit L [Gammaproteobacteria bacterium]NNJ79543.1 NADH-quinone oxidoreductase subunit L [Xanthomonadales bacterium]
MFAEWLDNPLTLPVTVPLLAGLLCLLLPARAERLRGLVAVIGTALTLGLAVPLWQLREAAFEPAAWLTLRVDALGGFVLLLIAFFALLVALYSVPYMKGRSRHRAYFTCLLWTLGVSCLAVLANDLLLLLVCWGFLGLLLYLMIGMAGPAAAGAARKSLMIIGASDALLLLGVVLYAQLSGSTYLAGQGTSALELDSPAALAAFLCLLAAALAKAGAVPFQGWVPDCCERADAPVSAYLPAALDKLLGIYLLARCLLDLFVPTPAVSFLLMLIGAVTILAMSLGALLQNDLKRLLGYTAVAQVGYIILGLATGTLIGLAAALFHMLNHAIYKSGLFLCAGIVERQAGTTDLDRLGGLARLMPLTFGACLIVALAGAGIPPLNGFASKWMVYQGIIADGVAGGGFGWIAWLAVAMLGSALSLAAFLKLMHAVFLCKAAPNVQARAERGEISDGPWLMRLPTLLLAALCVVFGVAAVAVPLNSLVFPAVGAGSELLEGGAWWSGLATALLMAAILAGGLAYGLFMRAGRLRRMPTYVGGERLDEVRVGAEDPHAGRHLEVTGTDFYLTLEDLPLLGQLFALARRRLFDLHHLLETGTEYVVQLLRRFHTGVLPAYLRWFLAGMLVVVWVVTQSGA